MDARPARSRAQTVAHLEERLRLARADKDVTSERIRALELAIASLRDGRPIERTQLENLPVDHSRWSA